MSIYQKQAIDVTENKSQFRQSNGHSFIGHKKQPLYCCYNYLLGIGI